MKRPNGEIEGVTVEPQTEAAFRDAELVVLSPGVPADLDLARAGARARRSGDRRAGAGRAISARAEHRHHGHQRKDHHHGVDRPHPCESRALPCQVGGNIGTAPAEMVETSRPDQWNVLELSSFQLETIETFRAPNRGMSERDAESSGPASHVRELCEREGAAVRNAAGRRSRGAERGRPECWEYSRSTRAEGPVGSVQRARGKSGSVARR